MAAIAGAIMYLNAETPDVIVKVEEVGLRHTNPERAKPGYARPQDVRVIGYMNDKGEGFAELYHAQTGERKPIRFVNNSMIVNELSDIIKAKVDGVRETVEPYVQRDEPAKLEDDVSKWVGGYEK